MPSRGVGVTDTAPAITVADMNVVEHASQDLTTTLTADPGAGGVALAVTANTNFPGTNNYKVRVENEVMLVTAGAGTNAWTVTRGIDGTTAVAHAIGTIVALVLATQRVENIDASRQVTYVGRAQTFRTPGRAGTAGQKVLSIHNATGSNVKVRVNAMWIDLMQTVVKALTVAPPIVRAWKVTVLPSNGTALTKTPLDSLLNSSASVTVLGDASADGTSSATALTATLPAGTVLSQEFAPRILSATAAGDFYEMFDRTTFFEGDDQYTTLNALEGIVLFLDYSLATQNPVTDMWIAGVEWQEYTVA
jgi:hypothetical protein